jgi:bifunctional non-homologous end joining protein LigD
MLDGHAVALTRLSKVLYPGARFTKAQVIDYYVRVAPFLLPHLRGRPVTLKRYPNGVRGEAYWDKDAPSFTPEWVERFAVPRRGGGPAIQYIGIANQATLAWTANIAALELHPFLHRGADILTPTSIVFDLDPGEGADILKCIEVAFLLRRMLEALGLRCFPKVSGSKGVQLYLPLNTPASYSVTQPFARAVAEMMEQRHPRLAVAAMPKKLRTGKVFIDWSQNSDYKTTVGVYSLRAKRDRPFVSMPVTWEEMERAGDLYFEPQAALDRLQRVGDLFAPVLTLQQKLPLEGVRAVRQEQSRRPEPVTTPRRSAQGGRRRFAVAKHGGGLELRLEMGRVVRRWNLPRGFSGPAAAMAEAPLDDSDFEGTWDAGTYEIVEGTYRQGSLHMGLAGEKVRGEFRLRRDASKGAGAWMVERAGGRAARAQFVEPMQCKLESELPEGSVWEYEAKLDGYRALAIKSAGQVSVVSRRNNPMTGDFPEIAAAFAALEDGTVVDGEIVALDAAGKPSFNRLQNRRLHRDTVRFYAFDLPVYGGVDLTGEPLRRRREMLEEALSTIGPPVYLSAPLAGTPAELLEAARAHHLEGIIGKRWDSRYEAGKRSGAWVKVKINLDQELVIGGYIPAETRHFDALLAGYYQGTKLIFAGKIRNGFKEKGSKERVFARFHHLGTERCPFDNLPEPANARRGMALTAEAMELCCWLKPRLVAQVGIREWTAEGHLRHSTFLGLREDKDPREVVREAALVQKTRR